jgi:hypothetical protein
MPTDPRVDAYIESKEAFAGPILRHLRTLIHTHVPTVEETIKWGMPFFTYKGQPLANMAAFKAHAAFGFWDRLNLATGQEGDAMGQYGRLTDLATLPPDAVLLAALDRALATIDAGEKPRRAARAAKPEADVPSELAVALKGDAKATATWTAFPPSCRREYCTWIGEAKRAETRAKRVAQAIDQLREGKRHNWQYANC